MSGTGPGAPVPPAEAPVLGLVCGGGRLPLLVAEEVRRTGGRLVAVAHEGETDPAISHVVDDVVWVRLGQLGHVRDALSRAGAGRVCFAGSITKVRFFKDVRPDALGLKLLARVATRRGDDRLLRAIAGVFEDEGMAVVPVTELAPGLLAPEGPLGRRKPDRGARDDIAYGLEVVRALGRLDVGQAVVVKDGVVLAVEATEGTDACIRRGGAQGRGSVVVVKAAKPGQDLRFDMPAIGPDTIRVLKDVGGGVLAVEAGRTLVLERDEVVREADAAGIPVVGVITGTAAA